MIKRDATHALLPKYLIVEAINGDNLTLLQIVQRNNEDAIANGAQNLEKMIADLAIIRYLIIYADCKKDGCSEGETQEIMGKLVKLAELRPFFKQLLPSKLIYRNHS